jgi:hypothetical protein
MDNGSYYFFDPVVVDMARRERDQVVAALGQKFVRAPADFIRWGLDDFRRYRRPATR